MAINLITLETPAPGERLLLEKLNEALVRELLVRSKSSGPALLGVTLMLWLIVRPWTGGVVLALFLAMAGLTMLRVAVATVLERRSRVRWPHMRAFCVFTAINFLIGLTLGAIIIGSFPYLPPLSSLMCVVCIVGVNFGAMVSLAGSPLVYLLYASSNMAALTFVAFAHPLVGLEHVFQATQIVFLGSLIMMVPSVHRSLRNNIVLRLQLAASLDELQDTQARLVEASREAGRADVAKVVLHNVGNVLNSVNVSAALVVDTIAGWKTTGVSRVAGLIEQQRDDLARFFRDDPRGQKIPEYLVQLAEGMERDKGAVTSELQSLTRNIEHIKVIVRSQQAQAKSADVAEVFQVHKLLEDALKFSAACEDCNAIEVVRQFAELPPVRLDRHKALQIVMNLFTNARDAVLGRAVGDRRIVVRAGLTANGDLEIVVADNGCGIDPEHLDRIFMLGFTTKSHGQGLGLHYSACAARELNGNLTARSAGLGSGASFLLVLPIDAAG